MASHVGRSAKLSMWRRCVAVSLSWRLRRAVLLKFRLASHSTLGLGRWFGDMIGESSQELSQHCRDSSWVSSTASFVSKHIVGEQ